jgi:hypothetical protein
MTQRLASDLFVDIGFFVANFIERLTPEHINMVAT